MKDMATNAALLEGEKWTGRILPKSGRSLFTQAISEHSQSIIESAVLNVEVHLSHG